MALPTRATRHMINRFSYGYRADLDQTVAAAGGPSAWFEAQVRPAAIPDAEADAMVGWFPYVAADPATSFAAGRSGKRRPWDQTTDLIRWTILRRMTSNRQLYETLVDVWSNLLHVPAFDESWMFRADYDATIRRYALGTYADLLLNATLHPAMGIYLDSVNSTRRDTNENHGRELLELHTVGVDAGYTEDMVKDSARILTGYHLEYWHSVERTYRPADHYVGPVSVLGFRDANSDPDGRDLARRYLGYLARHPATARRVATRLAQRFVADNPSRSLVDAVAAAYTKSDTDIPATLRALVAHPDFAASVDQLTRTPAQDAIATYRALGVKATRPHQGGDFGNAVTWVLANMGENPFTWPAPNGFPTAAAAWASVGRMRSSWEMHFATAGGWWPATGMSRPKPSRYLPAGTVRLSEAVDHLCGTLLARSATDDVVTAAAQLVGRSPQSRLDRDTVGDWVALHLITAVLNSPEHLKR